MSYHKLIKEVKKQVTEYFESRPDPRLHYHNIRHTERVVKTAGEIGEFYQYNEEQLFILTVAAWYHDIGYLTGNDGHEERGVVFARSFLTDKGVDTGIIDQIGQVILATRLPQNPLNQLEEILCDADLFNLGTPEFREQSKLLIKERIALNDAPVSRLAALEEDRDFLKNHTFFTAYCRDLLSGQQAENLNRLQEKIVEEKQKQSKAEARLEQGDRPERGVETMFRITSGNNQRLSDMADNKAHILITVNSIILSAIISLVLRKLDTNQYLIVPTIILLAVCLGAMVFSILATRPSIPEGVYTKEQVENKTVNLLFFGNFYRMHIDEYSESMFKVMADNKFLYGMLIRDVFTQGVVLGRKYRYLRLAYSIFMYGLVVAVVAYTLTSVLNGPHV